MEPELTSEEVTSSGSGRDGWADRLSTLSASVYVHFHRVESDLAVRTIGLSPSGHGSPSCPASRCLIKASIRLYPSQLNSASS
jgi:hypothetical protein